MTPPFDPDFDPDEQPPEDQVGCWDMDSSLVPVDLDEVLGGSLSQPTPTMLRRDDGAGLIYPGEVNGLHGPSGAGKGWVMSHLIGTNALVGIRTMWLDYEDHPQSIVARLLAIGMTPDAIRSRLVYVRPQVELGPGAMTYLCNLVRARNIGAVIVDSIGEAFAIEGIDENHDSEVGPWYRRVARPLADAGAGVVIIDHGTKSADNPLYPSGSKRKRAAVTGASYLLDPLDPFVKGRGGRLKLTCAKDRHGSYRSGEIVGTLVMGVDTRLTLRAPQESMGHAPVPETLAARAATASARKLGAAVSRNGLEVAMGEDGFSARAETKRGGIDLAVARGWLKEDHGPRNSRLYTFVRDPDDEAPRPTSSEVVPDEDTTPDVLVPSSGPRGPARDELGVLDESWVREYPADDDEVAA